jgi:hypothetical protein
MFTFKNYYKIESPYSNLDNFSDSLISSQPYKRGLEVKVEATHAGILNNNMRFYLPSRMREGADTFNNRPKPAKFLKHHNSDSDPIGIITGARYINTTPDILMADKDIRIMNDSSLTTKQQVAAVKRFMKSGIPFSDGWKGLGYIEVTARIFDEEAIEQIKDGRFDAVSTSFRSPGEAYCNICGQNLSVDGVCEHNWGQKYADSDEDIPVVCAVVPGVHLYDEMSLVVFAADPMTAISISMSDSKKDYPIDIALWKEQEGGNKNSLIEFKDFIKEEQMEVKDISLSEEKQKILDAIKVLRPETEEATLFDLVEKLSDFLVNEEFVANKAEVELDDSTSFLYALEAIETQGVELNADEIYVEMEKELEVMKDESLLSEAQLQDAKLSTESRNKLSSSTFCGPDKSFPVPDCAHATAARRLIGRYKGPGDKTRILACVSRKAKALGCNSDSTEKSKSEDDKIIEFVAPTCEQLKVASDKDVRGLFASAEAEMIERRLTVARECSKCEDSVHRVEKAETEKTELSKKLEENNNTLKVLRDELRRQYNDYSVQIDDYVVLGIKFESTRKELIVLKGILSGKFKSVEDGQKSLKGLNLDQEEIVIQDSLKLDSVIEKLNDGMARNPKIETPVTNPVSEESVGLSQFNNLSVPAKAAIEQIKTNIEAKKLVTARGLYDKMVAIRVLDGNVVSFESLVDSIKSIK